jgi:hypothetical protein
MHERQQELQRKRALFGFGSFSEYHWRMADRITDDEAGAR